MSEQATHHTEHYDTRFSLPAVDDPATTEVGVILLGLDAERLLAGLGLATLADDAGRVAVAVDRARHGIAGHGTGDLVAEGARRWREVRQALAEADPEPSTSASVRQAWARAHAAVGAAGLAPLGPSSHVYLTACRLRRTDIDSAVEGT